MSTGSNRMPGCGTDFNIPGFKITDLANVKRKSKMKAKFEAAGVPCAYGRVCRELSEAQALAEETGFPLVAKPDIGVGAYKTYKINNPAELEAFFSARPTVDYILEEFVKGDIQTFDGLVNQDGQIVFSSSMEYSAGVMDLVNEQLDFNYYITSRARYRWSWSRWAASWWRSTGCASVSSILSFSVRLKAKSLAWKSICAHRAD